MKRFLASLCARGLRLFGKRKSPAAVREITDPDELTAIVLPLVREALRKNKWSLPSDLSVLVADIHGKVPEDVRREDSSPNRADFAAIIQSAAILLYRCHCWIEEPW